MSGSLNAFIAEMKKATTCELASKAVDQLLTIKSPDELGKILVELAESKSIDDETLGYFVFPGLLRKLKEDKALLGKIVQLIKESKLPEKFTIHCIALLASYYRKAYGPTPPPEFVHFIHEVAIDKNLPVNVRARVARLLTRLQDKDGDEILENLIASRKAQLIEAACHKIARWSRTTLVEKKQMIDKLLDYVRESPLKALAHPQILRTVSRLDHRGVNKVLEKVIAQIRSKEDVVRLAACLAPGLSATQLAEIVSKAKSRGPEGRLAIRHLIRREPALLELLHQGKHFQELVEVIKTEPTSFGRTAIDHLRRIEAAEGNSSKEAAELRREIISARHNAFLSRERLRIRTNRSIACPSTAVPSTRLCSTLRYGTHRQPLYAQFSSGFNMGDALYRDTYILDPSCHNHWHAGIFQTFKFFLTEMGAEGVMRGVHMTGFPGAVETFTVSSDAFSSPQCDVAATMSNLCDKFLKSFMVDPEHPFHGARQTPTMSKTDRLNLLHQSEELTHRSIHYTFADMIDWHGPHWSGSVDDIDNLRCDGVVEYTYEACGKKVCVGKQAANWNIAAPGNQHPESHEDLHTWSLNDGELCPKVQAGAEGNDTTLIPTQPSAPEVTEFTVHEEEQPTGGVVVIKFNIKSENYYSIYVRILVGVEGSPLDFATTVANDTSGIAGKWIFKEVDEGTTHVAYWPKESHAEIRGGKLEFRLIAVDQGGNVSAEFFSHLPMN